MAERTSQYEEQIANVSIVYNVYRIVLPLVLLMTYISSPETSVLGILDPTLFVQVNAIYAIFGVILTFFTQSVRRFMRNQSVVSGMLIVDILVIALLIYTSRGVASGLGLFMIVTIAAGSILIRGRISTFLAAVATLAIIYSEIVLALAFEDAPNQFLQTGILGIILFATSLYVQTLTDRFYKTAKLADKQASDIVDLEKLNNEIIQRMRTGVMVVDSALNVLTMNSAARTTLLPLLNELKEIDPANSNRLPEIIADQLALWKINPKRQPQPISIPGSNKQLQLNFAFLDPETDSDILVFLEDNRQIVQRVRQMKLASLGRLTASIAHEVRNPLGAISHASQLLRESESVPDDDKRMIEIILDHCNRINLIIEDVLDASRHDDTSANRISLNEWVPVFIENYKATHEICDEIVFVAEKDDIQVNVITGQLEQVLNNLFDNGLRYSKKHTGSATLTVEAGVDENEGDAQPFLNIIDDGEGINEEAESRLFEPFHTTESTGTGLGLYISKELCEANQSQLVYGRTDEHKSCFSIYFSHPDRSVA
ncbi:MAG: ATP-binding protein [Pseudomonadales bacterium]|nr:ATP-binding protein [Pseudomonadales bacterium]